MSSKAVATSVLMEKLNHGWAPPHYNPAREFVLLWESKLNTNVEIKEISENALHFVTDLSDIRLRGMENVKCLLVDGNGPAVADAIQVFWKGVEAGRMPLVLTLSDSAYEQAHNLLPPARCLVLRAQQLEQLLDAADPRQFLKERLWQQVPKRRLIPYTTLRSVEGNMFFGRSKYLDRLRYEEDVSFAIAGPSRIGKTSLMKQYRRQMIRDHDPRASCIIYVNFYNCRDTTPNGVARFFAMQIASSSRSARMTAEDLVDFLRYQQHSIYKGPLDLLLDEVDEVCRGECFKFLGAAARQGICRLVLCGRGTLLKMMSSARSPLECRLELLRLEPLDDESARELLLRPLTDLGFISADPYRLVKRVLHLTGRLPHLIQFYGRRLANLAIDEGTDMISMEHVETLNRDFETAQYFTSPLRDIKDTETRLVALSLLKMMKDRDVEFPIPFVLDIAARQGLNLKHERVLEICNDLVIGNVLVWSNGSFRLANEAMAHYARGLGFLNSAFEEARLAVKGTGHESKAE